MSVDCGVFFYYSFQSGVEHVYTYRRDTLQVVYFVSLTTASRRKSTNLIVVYLELTEIPQESMCWIETLQIDDSDACFTHSPSENAHENICR